MPYEATCPKGHRLQVTEAHFGERVGCPTCGEMFVVPDPSGRPLASNTPPSPIMKVGVDRPRWAPALESMRGLSYQSLLTGRPLVAVGMVLVLFARGCDSIGHRGVQRAETKVQAAKDQFDEQWQVTSLDLEAKITTIEDSKVPKAEDQKALTDLKAERASLAERMRKARKQAETGLWRTLEANARAAKANFQINGYWREMFFVFASIVLALGLLMVGWTAQGPERWVSLVMLAIITFSLYIGGAAWLTFPR